MIDSTTPSSSSDEGPGPTPTTTVAAESKERPRPVGDQHSEGIRRSWRAVIGAQGRQPPAPGPTVREDGPDPPSLASRAAGRRRCPGWQSPIDLKNVKTLRGRPPVRISQGGVGLLPAARCLPAAAAAVVDDQERLAGDLDRHFDHSGRNADGIDVHRADRAGLKSGASTVWRTEMSATATLVGSEPPPPPVLAAPARSGSGYDHPLDGTDRPNAGSVIYRPPPSIACGVGRPRRRVANPAPPRSDGRQGGAADVPIGDPSGRRPSRARQGCRTSTRPSSGVLRPGGRRDTQLTAESHVVTEGRHLRPTAAAIGGIPACSASRNPIEADNVVARAKVELQLDVARRSRPQNWGSCCSQLLLGKSARLRISLQAGEMLPDRARSLTTRRAAGRRSPLSSGICTTGSPLAGPRRAPRRPGRRDREEPNPRT